MEAPEASAEAAAATTASSIPPGWASVASSRMWSALASAADHVDDLVLAASEWARRAATELAEASASGAGAQGNATAILLAFTVVLVPVAAVVALVVL